MRKPLGMAGGVVSLPELALPQDTLPGGFIGFRKAATIGAATFSSSAL